MVGMQNARPCFDAWARVFAGSRPLSLRFGEKRSSSGDIRENAARSACAIRRKCDKKTVKKYAVPTNFHLIYRGYIDKNVFVN